MVRVPSSSWDRRLRSIEDFQSDVVALQPLAATGQSFVDEVFEESLAALRLVKGTALQDTVQLLANGFLIRFGPAIARNFRHISIPNVPTH